MSAELERTIFSITMASATSLAFRALLSVVLFLSTNKFSLFNFLVTNGHLRQ